MPLKSGKSKSTISANIKELMKGSPSSARAKGIHTLAKNQGISNKSAKQKQAVAIAYSKAKK